jgi:hypothetical protein
MNIFKKPGPALQSLIDKQRAAKREAEYLKGFSLPQIEEVKPDEAETQKPQ